MRSPLRLLVTLALCIPLAGVARADFDAGIEAYKAGDFEAAAREFLAVAEAGNAAAQFNLAQLYLDGKGVDQDLGKAASWFLKAAEQGNAVAQYNLGVMYENGNGVEQDLESAVRWYQAAARRGNAEAQRNLGTLYFFGTGVPQDYIQAHGWFTLAAEAGEPTAARALDIAESRMKEGDRLEARKRSQALLDDFRNNRGRLLP